MHGEKALRAFQGRPLLEHSLEKLAPLADTLCVSIGTREIGLPPGVEALPDPEPYVLMGPLSGIYAGLKSCRTEFLVVLAVDLPLLPPGLPALLLERLARGSETVAFASHGGQPEPLVCALRAIPAREAVRAALKGGKLKVVPLWRGLACLELTDADLAAFAPLERAFANVNTLGELEALG
jgi:molybdopterin-guanine dinucleotide biosynthesis protein A